MSLNKNKSEIAESFKNLLKKADEVKDWVNENKLDTNASSKTASLNEVNHNIDDPAYNNTNQRLGIKSIQRVPNNPFKKKNKDGNIDRYKKIEHELTIRVNHILKRHLYHWLNRELPKYSKIKLRRYIYVLLNEILK